MVSYQGQEIHSDMQINMQLLAVTRHLLSGICRRCQIELCMKYVVSTLECRTILHAYYVFFYFYMTCYKQMPNCGIS
jgi:hypothetical protein